MRTRSSAPRARRARRRRARPLLAWVLLIGVSAVAAAAAGPAVGAIGVARAATDAAPPGPDLYLASCASCHGDDGSGTFRGPSLIGVGAASADYWLRSGRMPLAEPDAHPVRSEPAFSEPEIRALVAYVAALGDGPPIPAVDPAQGDLARGGELYRLNCAACHNWDGKGGALTNRSNAPPLHPVPLRQVAEAVRIGPGTMPAFAPDQLDDAELADVLAYVAYLDEPRDAGGFGLFHWGPAAETLAAALGLLVLVGVTLWLGERRRG